MFFSNQLIAPKADKTHHFKIVKKKQVSFISELFVVSSVFL